MADERGTPGGGEPRSPLSLEELLDILRGAGLVTPEQAREIGGRATTLRSRVLKQRVGSVRSQAAQRYDATAPEIVAAADLQNAKNPRRKLDEDAIAEAIAAAAGVPYLKIDPLHIDGDLITKTMSRPFARRHAVTPFQVALAFTLRHPDVIAIPKASDPAHVAANRQALDLQLTDEDLALIDRDFPLPRRKIPLEMI